MKKVICGIIIVLSLIILLTSCSNNSGNSNIDDSNKTIEPHIHSYEKKVTKEASCNEEGIITYMCNTCDDSYIEYIPKTSHVFFDGVCKNCGALDPSIIKSIDCISYTVKIYINNNDPKGKYIAVFSSNISRGCISGKVEIDYMDDIGIIIVNDSINSIDLGAFSNFTSLESITLPFVGYSKEKTKNSYFGYIFGAKSNSDNNSYIPSSLKEVIITGGASIAGYAFSECSSLTSITIPKSVTNIGYGAFEGCSSLTSITIPNSVTSIEDYVFKGCSSLTNVLFEKNSRLSSIGRVFQESSLTSITIPNSVTSIENYAFYNCSSLTNVSFEENSKLLSIGRAFQESSITSIIIPNSVTCIENYAFKDCSSLTSVEIPNSVTSIGDRAFCGCSSLTSITIPNSVTSIGSWAFEGCSSLTSITIPSSVTSIGSSTFENCSSLTSITLPFVGNALDGNNNKLDHIFGDNIPSSLKEVIITGGTNIGCDAFRDCSSLISVTIPKSVTSIGDGAFEGCSSLISVEIPNSVTSIGKWTFEGCSSLTSVEIPNSVTSIGSWAFYGCGSLTSIEIPNSVTSIGCAAFIRCNSLISITIPYVGATLDGTENTHFGYIFGASSYSENSSDIPNSLKEVIIAGCTSIKSNAFYGCSGLTSVTIPNSVTSIGYNAFRDCSSLTSITIPNSVTSIGSYAFENCNSLTNVYYNGTVEDWCNITFSNYYSNTMKYASDFYILDEYGSVEYNEKKYSLVTEIVIPDIVTEIGNYQFYGFNNVISIKIYSGVKKIGENAFDGCNSLKNVYYDGTIEDWCNITFNDYYSNPMNNVSDLYILDRNGNFEYIENKYNQIIDINIPDSITKIGNYQFKGFNNVTSIVIPSSVTSIEEYAFYGCSSLTSIEIPNSVTSIEECAFRECSSLTSITFEENSQLTGIGNSAFCVCSSLTSIEIPNSVTSIGDGAFAACDLTSITLPFVGATLNGTENTHFGYIFGASSYSENSRRLPSSLKEVIIDCTSIGQNAFYECSKLTNITMSSKVTSIGNYAFYNCTGLTSIEIPSSVIKIGNNAFEGCTSLEGIIIPDSVTEIGQYSFDCKLKWIVIGNGVKEIPFASFGWFDSASMVYFNGSEDEWLFGIDKNVLEWNNKKVYYHVSSKPIDDDNIGNYWHYVDGVPTVCS